MYVRVCVTPSLTPGGGGGSGPQAQVHGHLGRHGQQVVLEGLLHQTLLLLCQARHLPLWALAHPRLQFFPQLLQGGSPRQPGYLLMPHRQGHGGPRRQHGGRQLIWRGGERWREGER